MPITCSIPLRSINQEDFAELDYRVMRHAFDSQNELGRLCDEAVYQNDMAARLEAGGLAPVHKEVRLAITHGGFKKDYSLDLIIGNAAIYELKTANSFVAEFDAQLLNYLLLGGAHHGKLINFRPPKLESKFVNTSLTHETQREFEVNLKRWRGEDEASEAVRGFLLGVFEDWGCFLELALYVECVIHFLGGEEKVLQRVGLTRQGVPLGSQGVHLLTPDTAFRMTALSEGADHYEAHLRSLLNHSPMRAIQWINLARHQVQFVTITK